MHSSPPSSDGAIPPSASTSATLGHDPQRGDPSDDRGWGLSPAIKFLFPTGHRRFDATSGGWRRAAYWVVPFGMAVGLLWVGVFRFAWRLYGETANMRVVPAAAVVLMECVLTGPLLVLGLARTAHLLIGRHPLRDDTDSLTPLSPVGTLALCLTVFCQWALIVSVPTVAPWWPSPDDWRHRFAFVYPAPIYRPLLLAPLWGRWCILLAATVGRTAPSADPETVALADSMRPGRLLLLGAPPLILTCIYCSRDRNFMTGLIVALLVFGGAYLAAVLMARRGGGQTRQSLFAAGQIGQLTFLAIYRAFWPLLHG